MTQYMWQAWCHPKYKHLYNQKFKMCMPIGICLFCWILPTLNWNLLVILHYTSCRKIDLERLSWVRERAQKDGNRLLHAWAQVLAPVLGTAWPLIHLWEYLPHPYPKTDCYCFRSSSVQHHSPEQDGNEFSRGRHSLVELEFFLLSPCFTTSCSQ